MEQKLKVEFVKDEPDPGYEVEKPVEIEVPVEAPVVEAAVQEKVNINTASAKEINKVTGINITQCYSITGYRKKVGPYTCVDDVLKAPNIFESTLKNRRHLLEV
jgi:competence ComEA-like helix-hairpin-helix protein